jgi:hypothetical protein
MPTVIAPAMSAWTLSANTLILVLSMIGSGVMSEIGFDYKFLRPRALARTRLQRVMSFRSR